MPWRSAAKLWRTQNPNAILMFIEGTTGEGPSSSESVQSVMTGAGDSGRERGRVPAMSLIKPCLLLRPIEGALARNRVANVVFHLQAFLRGSDSRTRRAHVPVEQRVGVVALQYQPGSDGTARELL